MAQSAAERVSTLASELIKDGSHVLTHSRSSTVAAALLYARRSGKTFRVVATESRPLCEGRALASELAREGIRVTLIADAATAVAIADLDFVITGADHINPSAVVNKIGTRLIALAAREKGIPVYALADTTKFIGTLLKFDDDHPGEELWGEAPPGVEVINRYFEPVPLDLFAEIITERGRLAPLEASLQAAKATGHPALIDVFDRQAEGDSSARGPI
jgi:translation initiation factor 2B subunit (eIF-2B alpha/beta/delta family)